MIGTSSSAPVAYLPSLRPLRGCRLAAAGDPGRSELILLGRRHERQNLDVILDAARGGLSGTLVLRGEPGSGKTALLDYAAERAGDLGLARATGIESEMDLGFGALHQLLIPFLDRLDRLPVPQRDALGAIFGLTGGSPPHRFWRALRC